MNRLGGHLLITMGLLGALAGCASTARHVDAPPVAIAGEWRGTWSQTGAGGNMTYRLQQDGAKVTGEFAMTGSAYVSGGEIAGTVSGHEFAVRVSYGNRTSGGSLSVNGDTMTGTIMGMVGPYFVSLQRQKLNP